jgi:hypothetical protein
LRIYSGVAIAAYWLAMFYLVDFRKSKIDASHIWSQPLDHQPLRIRAECNKGG